MKDIRYILLLFGILITGAGCNDMLDLEPKTDPSDATLWKSPEDYELAANKFYEYLPRLMDFKDKFGDGRSPDDAVLVLDGIVDRDKQADLVFGATTKNEVSNSSYQIPAADNFYEIYYSRLRAINYLLDHAKSYSNQNAIKQYVAEAHFFRAWSSYLFFRDFGPGCIVESVLDINSPEVTGPRASRDDFFNWMMRDLEMAVANLSYESELQATSVNIGRISKGAAQALLARITLHEGTWQKYHYSNTSRANTLLQRAINNADSVMTDPKHGYELFYNAQMGKESYRWMFILENEAQSNPYKVKKESNKEYILKNRMHEMLRQSNQNVTHTYQSSHLSGTRKLIEMYLDDEGLPIDKSKGRYQGYTTFDSYLQNRDPRMQQCFRVIGNTYWSYGVNGRINWTGDAADLATQWILVDNSPGFFNQKWCTERAMADAYSDGFDVPIIRLGEICLIYAEALYEKNGSISDADLDKSINLLRDRVKMPHLTNGFASANGLNMLTEIRRERAVELYAEGLRLDDLRRWKTAETEMSGDLTGVPYFTGSPWSKNKVFTYNGVPYAYKALNVSGKLTADGYYIYEPSSDRTFEQKYYMKPIPYNQIALYPPGVLEQNPGWD